MVSLPQQPGPGVDTWDQPLVDAWFTPGFTAQNKAYKLAAVFSLSGIGWPADVPYVHVTHLFGDMEGNALGGFLTFVPNDTVQYTENGTTWTLPPRPCGVTPLTSLGSGWNNAMMDSGRCYLYQGNLDVYQIASDAPGLITAAGMPLTFHVIQHWLGGVQFDITTPNASSDPTDLYSLIIEGSVTPYQYDPRQPLTTSMSSVLPDNNTLENSLSVQSIVFGSTEYVTVNVSVQLPGVGSESPTADNVFIAVLSDPAAYPQDSDWFTAQWLTQTYPYFAGILEGPGAGGAVALDVGTYKVWMKIVDDPEIPVFRVGTLNIT
jgi:hypothetical protein